MTAVYETTTYFPIMEIPVYEDIDIEEYLNDYITDAIDAIHDEVEKDDPNNQELSNFGLYPAFWEYFLMYEKNEVFQNILKTIEIIFKKNFQTRKYLLRHQPEIIKTIKGIMNSKLSQINYEEKNTIIRILLNNFNEENCIANILNAISRINYYECFKPENINNFETNEQIKLINGLYTYIGFIVRTGTKEEEKEQVNKMYREIYIPNTNDSYLTSLKNLLIFKK